VSDRENPRASASILPSLLLANTRREVATRRGRARAAPAAQLLRRLPPSPTRRSSEELWALLSRQNQAGETPLFVAAEHGYVALVAEMMKYDDVATASIKAHSG
jgi:ankyrin repeat protein